MAAAAAKKNAPAQTLTEQQVAWMRGRRSDAPEALDWAHQKGDALNSTARSVKVPKSLDHPGDALPYLRFISESAKRQSDDKLRKTRAAWSGVAGSYARLQNTKMEAVNRHRQRFHLEHTVRLARRFAETQGELQRACKPVKAKPKKKRNNRKKAEDPEQARRDAITKALKRHEVAADQLPALTRHGQHVVVESLRAKSDIWLPDVDVFFPYDGFSIITLGWIENMGYCKPGGAGRFLEENWDDEAGCVMIDGRVPINPHGGSLSEGATRGSGHLREAVMQLRGDAGERQVADARSALIGCGGFFFNSQGAVLRRL